ncbi:hypothetical protein CIK06_17970 [Plantactinospora sp. KBS50]|nr:hypothetical protein CIK06_17970 [Plantactinospora sp. KBS50]
MQTAPVVTTANRVSASRSSASQSCTSRRTSSAGPRSAAVRPGGTTASTTGGRPVSPATSFGSR